MHVDLGSLGRLGADRRRDRGAGAGRARAFRSPTCRRAIPCCWRSRSRGPRCSTPPHLVIGVNAVDYSGYPDCRPEFIAAFENLARVATTRGGGGRALCACTRRCCSWSKAQIIREGLRLGVDYALTVSCYQADAQGRACGRCDSCRLRRAGFEAAGVADPTRYAAAGAGLLALGMMPPLPLGQRSESVAQLARAVDFRIRRLGHEKNAGKLPDRIARGAGRAARVRHTGRAQPGALPGAGALAASVTSPAATSRGSASWPTATRAWRAVPGSALRSPVPGLTNIATALGQAYGDSVPVLVISSENRTRGDRHRPGLSARNARAARRGRARDGHEPAHHPARRVARGRLTGV